VNLGATDVDGITSVLDALKADGLAAEPLDGTWIAARDGDDVVGVARVFERDGEWMLDDVWVQPALRGRGTGAALVREAVAMRTSLWLICDEDMVDYYARLGFAVRPDLPAGLAKTNKAKGYWQPADHVHVAMRTATA
jgi:GNAT superfamily N-acetyltransferase